MDASTYGRMVDRGGYATGGTVLVGESGPELVFVERGRVICAWPNRRRLWALPDTDDDDDGLSGALVRAA